MLRRGERGLRLESLQPAAGLDARRQLADRLIGWRCATANHPTQVSPAVARVRLLADGSARVEIAAHDVGTGAYTVIAQTAAESLSIKPEQGLKPWAAPQSPTVPPADVCPRCGARQRVPVCGSDRQLRGA